MKLCTKCSIEKPEEAFEMQPSRGHRRAECRECRRIAGKKWVAKRKLNPPQQKPKTKKCKQCQEIKPIANFSPASPGYFHARCRACENTNHQVKRREQYRSDPTGRFYWPFVNDAGITVKRCTYCHTEKPLHEFYANDRDKKRRHGKCKTCDKAIKRAEYDADPEKHRLAVRESSKRHPDRRRARYLRWSAAHKEHLTHYRRERGVVHRERFLAYDRIRHSKETPELRHMWYERRRSYHLRYIAANKERIAQTGRSWRKRFPERHADNQNRRRARQLNAPRIERIDRKSLIERDNWTCYLCLQVCTPKNVTLDHVTPLFHGGSHTADNLRVACRSCNSRKGHRLSGFLA